MFPILYLKLTIKIETGSKTIWAKDLKLLKNASHLTDIIFKELLTSSCFMSYGKCKWLMTQLRLLI